MKYRVCGSPIVPGVADPPFKVVDRPIVVLKGLPVIPCEQCSEYLLDDNVLEQVVGLLLKIDSAAELEVVESAV